MRDVFKEISIVIQNLSMAQEGNEYEKRGILRMIEGRRVFKIIAHA